MKEKIEDFGIRVYDDHISNKVIVGSDWEVTIYWDNSAEFPIDLNCRLIPRLPSANKEGITEWTCIINEGKMYMYSDLLCHVRDYKESRINQVELFIDEWFRTNFPNTVSKIHTDWKTKSENSEQHEPFSVCNKTEYEISKRREILTKLSDVCILLNDISSQASDERTRDQIDTMVMTVLSLQMDNVQRCLALKHLGHKID